MVKLEPAVGMMLVVGILALFAAFGYWICRLIKKQEAETKRLRMEFGFQEAPERAEVLAERMKFLHPIWNQFHHIENLSFKSEWSCELHLFDLRDNAGQNRHTDYDQAVMVSADLSLPRFMMFPRFEGPRILASAVDKFISWAASQFAVQAAFPDCPEFGAKYLLLGDDAEILRTFFTSDRRARLALIPGLQIEGFKDSFLFTRLLQKNKAPLDREGMQEMLDEGRMLHDILKG